MLGALAESNAKSGDDRHRVAKVSASTHSYYNSVNILTGSQGAGKTFAALMECLLIARQTYNTTILIFIKKKAYDPSYEAIKPLIEKEGCRCVGVEYEDAVEFVQEILAYKKLYNILKRAVADKGGYELPHEFDGVDEQQMPLVIQAMYDRLNIDNIERQWLNTLIVFDDVGASELFKKPDSYFNQRLKLCRDDNVIYFLTIHGLTQISASIKQNVMMVWIFKGLSRERLTIVWRQCNLPLDWGEMRGAYQTIGRTKGARSIIVDNNLGSYVIE
jgi:hypothetical protein